MTRKMMRLFLIGMLCGVSLAAAFTYVFAIPANDYRWQMEIWNRGGAAWTWDKNGHFGWKWLVEPIRDGPPEKAAIVPSSQSKISPRAAVDQSQQRQILKAMRGNGGSPEPP